MVKVPLPQNASTKRNYKTQALNANTNGGVSSNTKLLISEQANTASQHTT